MAACDHKSQCTAVKVQLQFQFPAGSHCGAQVSRGGGAGVGVVRSLHLHGCRAATESTETRFTSPLWRNDMRRGECSCQQVLSNVCVSSSSSFCGCYRCLTGLSPVSFDKPNAEKKKKKQRQRPPKKNTRRKQVYFRFPSGNVTNYLSLYRVS